MNQISIMTLSLLGGMYSQYRTDGDRESLKKHYEELLDLVRKAGYQAVDVAAFEIEVLGMDYVKAQMEKRGISVSSYIYFDRFALGEEGRKERIENARKAVDTAVDLGTEIVMLVPTAHTGIEKEQPEVIRRNLIQHWIPAAAYAAERRIHPVVEDTPDLRLCFCRASEVMEVLDAVPGLELVYDSGNMILDGEDPVEYAELFRGRIGFVHLKDVRKLPEEWKGDAEYMRDGTPTKAAPTGTGLIDLKKVVRILLKNGYQGGMTVEYARHSELSDLESMTASREYVENCLADGRIEG